jgi:hypothetical protein
MPASISKWRKNAQTRAHLSNSVAIASIPAALLFQRTILFYFPAAENESLVCSVPPRTFST